MKWKIKRDLKPPTSYRYVPHKLYGWGLIPLGSGGQWVSSPTREPTNGSVHCFTQNPSNKYHLYGVMFQDM
jgi:hypothetical protein